MEAARPEFEMRIRYEFQPLHRTVFRRLITARRLPVAVVTKLLHQQDVRGDEGSRVMRLQFLSVAYRPQPAVHPVIWARWLWKFASRRSSHRLEAGGFDRFGRFGRFGFARFLPPIHPAERGMLGSTKVRL